MLNNVKVSIESVLVQTPREKSARKLNPFMFAFAFSFIALKHLLLFFNNL